MTPPLFATLAVSLSSTAKLCQTELLLFSPATCIWNQSLLHGMTWLAFLDQLHTHIDEIYREFSTKFGRTSLYLLRHLMQTRLVLHWRTTVVCVVLMSS